MAATLTTSGRAGGGRYIGPAQGFGNWLAGSGTRTGESGFRSSVSSAGAARSAEKDCPLRRADSY